MKTRTIDFDYGKDSVKSRHKLTINADRVSIKFASPISDAECERVKSFFLSIAENLDVDQTVRGRMTIGSSKISLWAGSKRFISSHKMV